MAGAGTFLSARTEASCNLRSPGPVAAGAIWSPNIRVSGPTPPAVILLEPWVPAADALVGLHGLAASGGTTFALWTDRRDGDDTDTDVFGSRIRSRPPTQI